MAIGACSREDPQPKFCPPTITSPGLTFFAYSGLTSQKTFLASSRGSVVMLYRPGMISSVFMFSPKVQALPIINSMFLFELPSSQRTQRFFLFLFAHFAFFAV